MNQCLRNITKCTNLDLKKLFRLVKWSIPECFNRVRDLSRLIGEGNYLNMGNMPSKIKYCFIKYKYGLTFRPSTKYNVDRNFEFVIRVNFYFDYYNFPGTSKSVSEYSTFLCYGVVTVKISIQWIV